MGRRQGLERAELLHAGGRDRDLCLLWAAAVGERALIHRVDVEPGTQLGGDKQQCGPLVGGARELRRDRGAPFVLSAEPAKTAEVGQLRPRWREGRRCQRCGGEESEGRE